MPKTDKASEKLKRNSKASQEDAAQLPDETGVDDPKGAAVDELKDTRDAPVEVVSADSAEGKTATQAGPAATEPVDNDAESNPILGGKRRAVKVKDKNSGTTYDSKSKAGKALASEFGLDPNDNFVWYRIVKLSPDRFEEAGG